jgi:glutathione S-transferase
MADFAQPTKVDGKPIIVIFQPPGAWGLPNMSPFCVKLETWLRMAQLDYKIVHRAPHQGPKGKIPFASVDGEVLGDSSLIIKRIEAKIGPVLDQHLNPSERAVALSWQRLFEDHLYFGMAWLRWSNDQQFNHIRQALSGLLPPVIGPLILRFARKAFLSALRKQGMGRHTMSEVEAFVREDLQAVANFLGEKKFILGDRPSNLDATAYAFILHVFDVPWESELKTFGKSLTNLVRYKEEMKKHFW